MVEPRLVSDLMVRHWSAKDYYQVVWLGFSRREDGYCVLYGCMTAALSCCHRVKKDE